MTHAELIVTGVDDDFGHMPLTFFVSMRREGVEGMPDLADTAVTTQKLARDLYSRYSCQSNVNTDD